MYRCETSVSSDGSGVRRERYAGSSFFLLAAWSVWLLGVTPASATEATKATTSNVARRDALRAISLEKIDSRYRARVHQVLNDSSIYRRLPTQMVDCDPRLFTFLIQNPETLVEMWRKLGISRIELQRISENSFRLTDNSGTTGKLTLVEQNCDPRAQNRIVMYAEGSYEGKPFQRPVKAQCVLLLRSGSIKETNDRDYVAVRLDTFIRIDRVSIELLAKAVHPLIGRTADRNFADTLEFISNLSRAAETRPSSVKRLVSDLPHVSPESQERLIQIAYQCGTAGASERKLRN